MTFDNIEEAYLPDLVADPMATEVLAALRDVVIRVDDELRVTAVNRSSSPIFADVVSVGEMLLEVMDEDLATVVKALIDNTQITGAAIGEHRSAGKLFRITVRSLQSAPETLLVFENITGIRDAGQSLVDLIRYRSNFLSSVSRELRTPLTAVIGYADMLSNPEPDLDDEARQALVRDMTDQAWDLAGTIEDLLTVARAELGDLATASVSVNIAANIAQITESMGSKGHLVSVVGDVGVSGKGDPARFRQILRNLVSNAFIHGSEPVRIEIEAVEGHAVARVIDHGGGLPDEVIAAFNQDVLGTADQSQGGLGVGLWICRELADLMGGYLRYRRQNDETVFEVAIPLN